MATPQFSRRTVVSVSDSLLRKIEEKAFLQMSNRINKLKQDLEPRVSKIIIEAIKGHPVYKGLDGRLSNFEDGSDLQAEFGLTNTMKDSALEKMIKILEETIEVVIAEEKTSRTRRITVKVLALDPDSYKDELENGAEFSYNNRQTGKGRVNQRIEWMKWTLNPSEFETPLSPVISKNGAERYFGITYSGIEGSILSEKESAISRSGRAIMSSIQSIVKNFPYKLPKILTPSTSASNFIEEVRKDRVLRKKVGDTIEERARKILSGH